MSGSLPFFNEHVQGDLCICFAERKFTERTFEDLKLGKMLAKASREFSHME